MMDSEFNWTMRHQQIVENHSDMLIPPDITFQFEEDDSEIHAHKMMMGMVSPVFNKMFFGADFKEKDAKKLLIKGTTFGAFNITKNAIYGITSMENGLKGKSVLEVFSVLDLVTRYQILELRQVVRNQLASLTITDDNVLELAATASEKSSTFEDEAQELLILCAKFLKSKLKTGEDVFKYIADHKEDKDIVNELLALANDVDIGPSVCPNCRQELGYCQDGENIENREFREGLIVTHNDNDWWSAKEKGWGNAIVTKVLDASTVHVKSVKSDVNEYKYKFINMNDNEGYRFQFACK